MHLADKDAIADRNVVPGARLQLCILHSSSLTHRHIDSFFSSPPPLCPCRLSVLLSPSRQCFSLLSFLHPSNSNAFSPSHIMLLSSYLSSLPPTHLLPYSPLANSCSTPSFLRHSDFMAISRKPFIMSSSSMFFFLKYVCLIQVVLQHKPGFYFVFLWREAALWTGRQCLIEA